MFTLLSRHDFTAFAHMSIHVLLGTTAPNQLLWHVEAMAHVVDEITVGHCRRAIITVPPRCLKSTVATAAHIAWRLGDDPTTKILLVCYSKDLAKELLGKARAIMAHPWYRSAFPGVAETLRINRADFIETACGGNARGTSFAAVFTGTRLIIEHGAPRYLRSDNGPEFVSNAILEWLETAGIETRNVQKLGR
ncbi:MAG: hypothetical protein JWO68_4048 [Actinomycetia bacterium]|nr:hypothetical protein [Actinomycetes bacterium]